MSAAVKQYAVTSVGHPLSQTAKPTKNSAQWFSASPYRDTVVSYHNQRRYQRTVTILEVDIQDVDGNSGKFSMTIVWDINGGVRSKSNCKFLIHATSRDDILVLKEKILLLEYRKMKICNLRDEAKNACEQGKYEKGRKCFTQIIELYEVLQRECKYCKDDIVKLKQQTRKFSPDDLESALRPFEMACDLGYFDDGFNDDRLRLSKATTSEKDILKNGELTSEQWTKLKANDSVLCAWKYWEKANNSILAAKFPYQVRTHKASTRGLSKNVTPGLTDSSDDDYEVGSQRTSSQLELTLRSATQTPRNPTPLITLCKSTSIDVSPSNTTRSLSGAVARASEIKNAAVTASAAVAVDVVKTVKDIIEPPKNSGSDAPGLVGVMTRAGSSMKSGLRSVWVACDKVLCWTGIKITRTVETEAEQSVRAKVEQISKLTLNGLTAEGKNDVVADLKKFTQENIGYLSTIGHAAGDELAQVFAQLDASGEAKKAFEQERTSYLGTKFDAAGAAAASEKAQKTFLKEMDVADNLRQSHCYSYSKSAQEFEEVRAKGQLDDGVYCVSDKKTGTNYYQVSAGEITQLDQPNTNIEAIFENGSGSIMHDMLRRAFPKKYTHIRYEKMQRCLRDLVGCYIKLVDASISIAEKMEIIAKLKATNSGLKDLLSYSQYGISDAELVYVLQDRIKSLINPERLIAKISAGNVPANPTVGEKGIATFIQHVYKEQVCLLFALLKTEGKSDDQAYGVIANLYSPDELEKDLSKNYTLRERQDFINKVYAQNPSKLVDDLRALNKNPAEIVSFLKGVSGDGFENEVKRLSPKNIAFLFESFDTPQFAYNALKDSIRQKILTGEFDEEDIASVVKTLNDTRELALTFQAASEKQICYENDMYEIVKKIVDDLIKKGKVDDVDRENMTKGGSNKLSKATYDFIVTTFQETDMINSLGQIDQLQRLFARR